MDELGYILDGLKSKSKAVARSRYLPVLSFLPSCLPTLADEFSFGCGNQCTRFDQAINGLCMALVA